MLTLPLRLLEANERALVARHERSQEPSLFNPHSGVQGPPQVEPPEADRLTTGEALVSALSDQGLSYPG